MTVVVMPFINDVWLEKGTRAASCLYILALAILMKV
jgi:hypothetical protein